MNVLYAVWAYAKTTPRIAKNAARIFVVIAVLLAINAKVTGAENAATTSKNAANATCFIAMNASRITQAVLQAKTRAKS